MDHELQRRSEDRDVLLNRRLDQIERNYMSLSHQVVALESNVNIVKIEQGHLKELFGSRFTVVEKAQEATISQLVHISESISALSSDMAKSPLGRSITILANTLQATLEEHTEKIAHHAQWQDRVDGVLNVLKWLGAAGVAALILSVLRMLRFVP